LLVQNGGGNLLIGTGYQNPSGGLPVGILNQSGGTITCLGELLIPETHPATGTATLSGNAVVTVGSWLCVGRGGNGTLNISGNASLTRTGSGSHFDVAAGGDNGAGSGVINQTGGSITDISSDFWLGEVNTATWNMSGGTNTLLNLVLSVNNGVNSTMNLNGGLLQVSSINSTSTVAFTTLNLNGGTLQARTNSPLFINGIYQTAIGAGGAIFDSQAYNITIPEILQDPNSTGGSVTKLGSGTVILSGANSFGGNMSVSNGLLEVSTASSGGGAVLAAAGAGFGTLVASANSQLPVASLTLNGPTNTLFFDLGSFGNPSTAPLGVTGAFTASGTITVNVAASVMAMGTIPLVQYGSFSGTPTFVIGSLPAGVVANVQNTGGMLELVVTSAGAPRWNGTVTGDWDFGTNQDWFDLGTLLPTTYKDGEPVVFDDNASGTTTVDLTATVSPASLNFNNNSLSYTIMGTGKISGTTGLNVNGSGTVAILNTGGNNFTGPVVITNGGTLSVASLANGGAASALGASSSSPGNLIIGDGVLSYTGATVTANRGFTIAGTNAVIDAIGNLTLGGHVTAVNNVVDGGSAFTKIGLGVLDLTGSGDNEFSMNFPAGVNVEAGTLMIDGSAGNQTNHTQNQLYVGSTTTNGANLVLTNASLNVDSWLALGRINGDLNNTSTITLYNSAITCGNLSLGWDGNLPNNLASQFVTLNGNSSLTNYGAVNLPEGANSSMTLTVNNNSLFWVQNPFYECLAANTTGTVVVANSGKIISANGWFDIGQGNNCLASFLLENNGSLAVNGDLNLADTAAGANSTLTAQDNATIQANTLWVGKSSGSVCVANIAGSAAANFNNYIDLASGSTSSGTLNIAGGSVTDGGDMTVGDQGTAVVNMVTNGGGVLTVKGTLYLSRGSQTANGTVNLNAGTTIVADYINNGWGFTKGYSSPLDNPNAFNFNGGTLKANVGSAYFMQPYVNAVVQAGGAIINDGGYTIDILAGLVAGSANGGLTKLGNGTLHLDGVNTYTGSTLVSAGALGVGPNGAITGPVTVASGAQLDGDTGSIETLTISNTLTLAAGSTTVMSLTTTTNDEIIGLTSVNYGGALVVTNSGSSPLVVGQQYTLFNAASAGTGNFSSVTILPGGSFAGTFNPVSGVLTITPVVPPTVNKATLSAGNLILTGAGGTPNGTYSLLTATNLAAPVSAWTTNTTGVFSASGLFSNAIPVTAGTPAQFFRLKTP
jgi:autotransporter-associated beta strand protein/T5SS/PEP-CTERM-associated repeat protein